MGVTRSHLAPLSRRIAFGALLGAIGGVCAIGIGIVRFLIAIAGALVAGIAWRSALPTWQDARFVLLYVASFAAAGILIGALWPVTRNKVGLYVAFAAGGVLGTWGIVVAANNGRWPDAADLWFIGLFGPMFGGAAAHGFTKE